MASSAEAARALVHNVAVALHASGVNAALVGGQAVNCWVEPRTTLDVDVTVSGDGEQVRRLVGRLTDAGFQVLISQDDQEPSGPGFVRFAHAPSSVELDLLVAKTEFEDGVVRRAVTREDVPIPVATPEDLLVLKLLAARSKDGADLLALAALPQVDWAYVQHWCDEWEIADRLAELRAASESELREIRALYF